MAFTRSSVLLMWVMVSTATAQSQGDTTMPCAKPEARQFDFWLGEWNLTWSDSLHGTNSITKPLSDCVILEQFADSSGNGFAGMSVSVYDQVVKQWRQTWVDNAGNYMEFAGGFKDGKMILSREKVNADGSKLSQRMVWRDISADSLIWDWQSSVDNGTTWKTNWEIVYRRRQ